MATTLPVAAVVGAGPGLGFSLAKRFAAGGYHVALMARDKGRLAELEGEIRSSGGQATAIECDSTHQESVAAAFDKAKALGDVDVLLYNAAGGFPWPPPKFVDAKVEALESALAVSCTGTFLCCQAVVPGMLERAQGTILITGATASVRGSAGFGTFAAGMFARRGLAQSLARELHPKGIHVAHVIVDGVIATPRVKKMLPDRDEATLLHPDDIAEVYWNLHKQPKSAWTQELDLRPYTEKF